MRMRIATWVSFVGINDDVTAALSEVKKLVEPHMDCVMDVVYDHIAAHPEARAAFPSEDAIQHARKAQRNYWLNRVLSGDFGADYAEAATRVGRAHFAANIDLHIYMGTYAVVLDKLVEIISVHAPEADRRRYIGAVTRAVFMDMGLTTTTYYDAEVARVLELSTELNASLARAGEFRDNETGKHITRMSRMCGILAEAVGQDADWVRMMVAASPLHDVGKIGIPDDILLKPARLTPDEMTAMRRHPAIGGEIIPNHSSEVIRMARRIALTHHERWDGAGYPVGLKGEEIPLEGRIAAVCDVFDALVSNRPYKEPWTVDMALAYMRDNAGTHFDPDLIDAFFRVVPEVLSIQKELSENTAAPAS